MCTKIINFSEYELLREHINFKVDCHHVKKVVNNWSTVGQHLWENVEMSVTPQN